MNEERRNGLSPWADDLAHESRRGSANLLGVAVILGLLCIAFLAGAMLATPAQGAEPAGERIERLGADGTCTFTGPIDAWPSRTAAVCLTGLYFGQPISAQVETGADTLAGWIVANEPGALRVVLLNLGPAIDAAHVVVRVALATPAPPHPCEAPPPTGHWTMRDRCIADACAAGREPICLVKTSAPGTGMPGAD